MIATTKVGDLSESNYGSSGVSDHRNPEGNRGMGVQCSLSKSSYEAGHDSGNSGLTGGLRGGEGLEVGEFEIEGIRARMARDGLEGEGLVAEFLDGEFIGVRHRKGPLSSTWKDWVWVGNGGVQGSA